MITEHACPNCGAPVPLRLLLCPACREHGWDDRPHHLTGDELALYLELRRSERRKSPQGWWLGDEGLERGAAILRWHVQRELGAATRAAVLAVASLRTMEQARLRGWFNPLSRPLSVYEAFNLAFPDLALRPWELPSQVPRRYWEAGGDQARTEALRWWLERLGLSAQQVLVQVEARTHGVERQLAAAGLGELTHDRSLRALLHLVDPSIPVEPPPSARQRVRDEATLECPRCGQRLRSLASHLAVAHPELSLEERQALLAGRERLSPASLARYQRGGRAPLGDVARWRKCGPAFPASWWLAEQPGVALTLKEQPNGPMLQLTPDAQAQRRLHRNGRWWELRMPHLVRAAVTGASVVRAESGVQIGPLGEERATTVRRWLGERAAEEEEG